MVPLHSQPELVDLARKIASKNTTKDKSDIEQEWVIPWLWFGGLGAWGSSTAASVLCRRSTNATCHVNCGLAEPGRGLEMWDKLLLISPRTKYRAAIMLSKSQKAAPCTYHSVATQKTAGPRGIDRLQRKTAQTDNAVSTTSGRSVVAVWSEASRWLQPNMPANKFHEQLQKACCRQEQAVQVQNPANARGSLLTHKTTHTHKTNTHAHTHTHKHTQTHTHTHTETQTQRHRHTVDYRNNKQALPAVTHALSHA